MNRLVYRYEPGIGRNNKISIHLPYGDNDIDIVWRRLGGFLGLGGVVPDPEILVEEVVNRCQAGMVVLVIHGIEQLMLPDWSRLMEEFWQPLVDRLRDWPSQDTRHKVLLFLVGYQKDFGHCSMDVVSKVGITWDMQKMLAFPALQSFEKESHLEEWILSYQHHLPNLCSSGSFAQVAERLFRVEEGKPEPTMRAIAERCHEGSWDKICKTLDL